MEQVGLSRYEASDVLGSGADYEARSAVDQQTGQQVVLKRPMPQMIIRRMHGGTEARTDRTLQVFQEMDRAMPQVVPILGYTDRANHDWFYGDSLGQEYRVVVEERARGIPLLVSDARARITGVPVGAGQNLFALYPLVQPAGMQAFPIHRQLLDLEEMFVQAGYILLDLRPQNIFYQPGSGRVTVIDCGALTSIDSEPVVRGRPAPDIHDFYLEMLKFFTTPQRPPTQAGGYRYPYGQRPVVNFDHELQEMAASFDQIPDPPQRQALHLIKQVRSRAYTDLADFRRDLEVYLDQVTERNDGLPNLPEARTAWGEALGWLRGDHWQRYLFDQESELADLERQLEIPGQR